jgi:TPR repeat protein
VKRALLFLACIAAGPDEAACRQGVAEACVNLGMDYESGAGMPVDLERALALYDVGCDAGVGAGCVNAGVLRAQGQGVTQDLPAATGLFRKGCDLGVAEGCLDIGTMLIAGIGVAPDPAGGIALLEKGCDLGHAGACLRAADAWHKGVRTPTVRIHHDRAKARALRARGCAIDPARCR